MCTLLCELITPPVRFIRVLYDSWGCVDPEGDSVDLCHGSSGVPRSSETRTLELEGGPSGLGCKGSCMGL